MQPTPGSNTGKAGNVQLSEKSTWELSSIYHLLEVTHFLLNESRQRFARKMAFMSNDRNLLFGRLSSLLLPGNGALSPTAPQTKRF